MLDSFINLGTAALACIVGVILLLTRVLKQSTLLQLPASGRLLVVRDTIRLDARRQLHLVEYGRREVLLLTGGESDVVVGWFERPATP